MANIFMCVCVSMCLCVLRYEIRLKLVFLSPVSPFSHQIKCEISLHDVKSSTDGSFFSHVCAYVRTKMKQTDVCYQVGFSYRKEKLERKN